MKWLVAKVWDVVDGFGGHLGKIKDLVLGMERIFDQNWHPCDMTFLSSLGLRGYRYGRIYAHR